MIRLLLNNNLICHIYEENWKKKELIDHLTRVCAAYRKSYKLYGRVNKALQITGGILVSTAVLAIVLVIPVFVAAISVVPIVIGTIANATKLNHKKLF